MTQLVDQAIPTHADRGPTPPPVAQGFPCDGAPVSLGAFDASDWSLLQTLRPLAQAAACRGLALLEEQQVGADTGVGAEHGVRQAHKGVEVALLHPVPLQMGLHALAKQRAVRQHNGGAAAGLHESDDQGEEQVGRLARAELLGEVALDPFFRTRRRVVPLRILSCCSVGINIGGPALPEGGRSRSPQGAAAAPQAAVGRPLWRSAVGRGQRKDGFSLSEYS